MPSFTITVDDVKSREVRTKDGRESRIFQIFDDRGTRWETWKKQIANEAYRLIGQTARIQGRIEQNGQYENHYIDDIEPANGNNAPERDYAPQQPERQQTRREPARWEPDGKDWNIMRQTACKVSAQLAGNDPRDFWVNLDALTAYMAYGQMPPEFQFQSPLPPSRDDRSGGGNQFVPDDFDPGREDRPMPDDSDIPF